MDRFSSRIGSILHSCGVAWSPDLAVDAPSIAVGFDIEDATVEKITDIINSVNKNKSPGCYHIPLRELQRNVNIFYPLKPKIINLSLASG